MTISTIITTYRRPVLLKRAINSVLKQTYADLQVCVYDNASDDETEAVVRKIAQRDSRVKYYRHEANIGMMPNYQFAFDRIETPYFSLLSDDDYLLPCFYETALKGFHDFPDAAFSACGILQMDVNGNLIGDPLARWKSEGFYSAADGLIEMIKTRWRFPVPTGVLFQNKIVQNIKPNFSSDIDFFWDPDYLMRIVARHPIVITKKHCGVYLAHPESFANSFYSNLINDLGFAEKYLKATILVKQGIEESHGLEASVKRTAMRLLRDYVKNDSCSFIGCYIINRKLRVAHDFSMRFYHYYGFSPNLMVYHVKAIATKCFLLFLRLFKLISLFKFAKKRFFSFLRKIGHVIKKNSLAQKQAPPLDFLRDCHEYGKKLFDDNF